MIKKYVNDYVMETTRVMNEKYKHNLTEKQVAKILKYFQSNIIHFMSKSYDIEVKRYIKLSYDKPKAAHHDFLRNRKYQNLKNAFPDLYRKK